MHLFSWLDKSFQNANKTWRFQLFSSSINIRRQAMFVHPNIKAHSRKLCCRGKVLSTTYSEWFSVALVIQHAKRVRRIIFSAVVCPVLPSSSTWSHKRRDFRGEKGNEHKMCVSIFSTTFAWKISHSAKNSATCKCTICSCTVPGIFARF